MRIDYEYIGKILNIFLDSESATVDWDSFSSLHNNEGIREKFIFHIEILKDKKLIMGDSETDHLGIIRSLQGDYHVSIVPWRLTANGHDFANAITKPSVMTIIKDKFQKEGFSAIIDIAKKIATKHADKIFEDL